MGGSDTGDRGIVAGDRGGFSRPRAGRAPLTAALLALLWLGGCAGEGGVGTLAQPVAPPAEAPRTTGREVGRSGGGDADHAALVAAFGGEVRAPVAQRLLAEVTDRLVRATDRPDETYAVTLLDSPVVNAFALPNGRLYVTRGLLALADDTSEMAAVLAHEIAHVTLRHAVARTEMALRSALVKRVVDDVLNDPATGAILEDQSRFALASFSRAQEFEADGIGVRTLARAGYDPFGAARFLTALNRTAALRPLAGSSAPDMLATHPSTPERIVLATQAARRIGAPGLGADERARYLAAIDGLPYGDAPGDGVLRGRRFLHPRLGVAFEVPDGYRLDNTPRAVVGATPDGMHRLLFDAVEAAEGQALADVLRRTWNDALGSVDNRMVNGFAVATGTSRGKEWTFRLAAIRVGANAFRLVMAAKSPGPETEIAFERWIASVTALAPEEATALRPLRLQVVAAGPGDGAEALAARMVVPDRALERFLVLNGLERGDRLKPGERYKIVVE